MYFRNLVLSAFVIAIIAGAIFSIYQTVFITPIILEAETYEVSEPIVDQVEVWSPDEGIERLGWSFLSNFLVCFSYALILLSFMSFKPPSTAFIGLFWGGSAYLIIFAAPALGLPPEIPGMEAAYLEGRQGWWIITIILTALSLWLIAFENIVNKVIGLVLMTVPHIIGAPQPEIHGFDNDNPIAVAALTDLWHQFILQSSLANALLWVCIGLAAGILTKKYIQPLDEKINHH